MDRDSMNYYMKQFKVINLFSLCITLLFAGVLCIVGGFFTENLFGVPLYGLFILWSVSAVSLIDANELKQGSKERFARDAFLISYSFYSAGLIEILIQHNNADVMGWWLFGIHFITLVGLSFSLLFSTFALCLGPHRTYTFLFSLAIIILFMIKDFFPWYAQISFVNSYIAVWLDIIGLLILHALICLSHLLKKTWN